MAGRRLRPKRCSAFDARRSVLGARRLDARARCSVFGARRSVLGARCSVLGARRSALCARRSGSALGVPAASSGVVPAHRSAVITQTLTPPVSGGAVETVNSRSDDAGATGAGAGAGAVPVRRRRRGGGWGGRCWSSASSADRMRHWQVHPPRGRATAAAEVTA